MAAAAAYEAERKQEAEEAAHLAIAQRNAKRNGKKNTTPMSYRQIAKAYAAAKYNFNATLNKAQEMGLGDEDAAKLKADVAKSGTIGASLGAAQGYIVQKQAEQEAQAAAKRQQMEAQRAEKKEALLEPPAPSMQVPPQADGYEAVEALRASRAANSQASASTSPWQSAWSAITTTAQRMQDGVSNFAQEKAIQPIQTSWNTLKSLAPTRDQWEQMGLRIIVASVPLAITLPLALPVLVGSGLLLADVHYGPKPLDAFFGRGTDSRGIRLAQENMQAIQNAGLQNNVPPIAIASGIAVQSQWGEYPWDDFEQAIADTVNPVTNLLLHKEYIHPSYGLARISPDEMKMLDINGNPNDPAVSAEAMAKRIELAVNACRNCSADDKIIIAGMAQNGVGFTAMNVKDILNPKYGYQSPDGTINWNSYFDSQKAKSPKSLLDQLRIRLLNWRASGQNYDTQFQLRVFTNDLQALANSPDWNLPQGMGETELNYMQCLANRHPGDVACQP
ncbi:MAG: hypothetical protein M1282_00475 [Chloroflexi bacterium]|nr:hypothetical protein [Chloroflexota bacterium]